jgi:hypothetical protein
LIILPLFDADVVMATITRAFISSPPSVNRTAGDRIDMPAEIFLLP